MDHTAKPKCGSVEIIRIENDKATIQVYEEVSSALEAALKTGQFPANA